MGDALPQRRSQAPGLTTAHADLPALCSALARLPPCFALSSQRGRGDTALDELRSPLVLKRELDRLRLAFPDDDIDAAVSRLIHRFAVRLASPSLAVTLLHGLVLVPRPSEVFVRAVDTPLKWDLSIVSDAAMQVAHGGPDGADDAILAEQWHRHWVDGMLSPVADAARALHPGISGRRVWGNIAAAVDDVLSSLHWLRADRGIDGTARALRTRVGLYRRHSRLDLAPVGDRMALVSLRHACCMVRRVDRASTCPSCPSISADQRAALLLAQVDRLDEATRRADP
jgi:hypothetical protein